MTVFVRSAKVSTILLMVFAVTLVLLFSFSRTLGLTMSASAQDDKPSAEKAPPSDPPSADKKDERHDSFEHFYGRSLQPA